MVWGGRMVWEGERIGEENGLGGRRLGTEMGWDRGDGLVEEEGLAEREGLGERKVGKGDGLSLIHISEPTRPY